MEKKKLLIVAVSVGVVLLIIIGIPLLMIVPRQNIASASSDTERDWVTAIEPGIQRIQPLPEAVVETQTNTDNVQAAAESAITQPEETSQIILAVPIPQTAAVPHVPAAQPQKPTQAQKPTVKLSPAPQPAPAAVKQPVANPAPAPKAAAKPAVANTTKPAAAKTYNNYWVQTGAFSTMVRAEVVRESLASKGITSIIDNRDIDGKTWFRVRVGPYVSETEANYWLALVKSIDGFADSQIRLTQVLQ